MFLNSLGLSLSSTIGNHILIHIGGSDAVSAYTIISKIQGFITTPFSGVMQGIQPMLGFDLGRSAISRLKKTMHYAFTTVVVYGTVIAIGTFILAEVLMRIFINDEVTISMGKTALRILAVSFMAGGILPCIQAFFHASGNGGKVLSMSMISIFVIRIPLLFMAAVINNLTALWWMLAATEWCIALLGVFYYKREGLCVWRV